MDIAHKRMLLDEVRRVLFSRSNSGEPFLTPVSTLSIRNALTARAVSGDVSVLLEMLLSLRDVQNLPYGHWLPVSSRAVSVDDFALLVSGLPTGLLRQDLEIELGGRGLGRLVRGDLPSSIPREPLLRWLGVPSSTIQWCENHIRTAEFGDPLGWQDLSVYNHWAAAGSSRWISAASARLPDGPILARSSGRNSSSSHYLLLARDGAVRGLKEFSRPFDSRRFGLAMLARSERRYTFSVDEVGDTCSVRCPFLPHSEKRLLNALGEVEATDRGLIATIPVPAIDAVRDVLSRLGLSERNSFNA